MRRLARAVKNIMTVEPSKNNERICGHSAKVKNSESPVCSKALPRLALTHTPGVDDGIRTEQESLALLDEYERAGIKEVWFTPHIMEDVPNTTSGLKERFDEFTSRYKGNIRLHIAAENMLDTLFEERLKDNDLLTIGNSGQHLLLWRPLMSVLPTRWMR